mgnify:CR=1 FL=1
MPIRTEIGSSNKMLQELLNLSESYRTRQLDSTSLYSLAKRRFQNASISTPDIGTFPTFLTAVHKALDYAPWPHLNALAQECEAGQSQVILKARQIGVSWLLASYATYKMLNSQTVLMFSKGQREASELMEKARRVYDVLPDAWRPALTARNDSELATATGRILAFPSTEDAGRGWTADLIIADEAAFHPYAARNYQSYRPASLDMGGQMLMVSTANGPLGFFHEMYQAAVSGASPQVARFLSWRARPGRDDAWLALARRAFVGLPAEFDQEYPSTDAMAFVALTGLVYPIDKSRVVQQAPCRWEDYKYRYVGIDFGGGDPSAIVLLGITGTNRIHQHAELYKRGPLSAPEIADWLSTWRKAPISRIACDPSEPSMIETLQGVLGRVVIAADNRRGDGLAAVGQLLEPDPTGRTQLTIDPSCDGSLHEFDGYRWLERVDPNSRERYRTGPPVDHHADAMDARRYAVMAINNDRVLHDWSVHEVRVRVH